MSKPTTPVPDELRRSARKTLALEIRPDGTLLVRAPLRMSRAAIDRFLREKADWIAEKQQKARENAQNNVLTVQNGACWPLFDREVRLVFAPVKKASLCEENDVLYLPADTPEAALERFYREQTWGVCSRLVGEWAPKMDVTFTAVKVNGAKTRWGSCSAGGNLNFTWRLGLCPLPVVEYVVIHELCHRRHMDHSAAFWHMVADYCPDYMVHKRWLKSHNAFMLAE